MNFVLEVVLLSNKDSRVRIGFGLFLYSRWLHRWPQLSLLSSICVLCNDFAVLLIYRPALELELALCLALTNRKWQKAWCVSSKCSLLEVLHISVCSLGLYIWHVNRAESAQFFHLSPKDKRNQSRFVELPTWPTANIRCMRNSSKDKGTPGQIKTTCQSLKNVNQINDGYFNKSSICDVICHAVSLHYYYRITTVDTHSVFLLLSMCLNNILISISRFFLF